jgi:hypothetical protein
LKAALARLHAESHEERIERALHGALRLSFLNLMRRELKDLSSKLGDEPSESHEERIESAGRELCLGPR